MGRFVEGADRTQLCLLPEALDDWVDENNPVHVIEAFVDALDLPGLGFNGVMPADLSPRMGGWDLQPNPN